MIMTEQWLQDSANEGCEAICIIAMEKVLQEEVKFQHSVLEYLGYWETIPVILYIPVTQSEVTLINADGVWDKKEM